MAGFEEGNFSAAFAEAHNPAVSIEMPFMRGEG
jgi:hypothetical protein